MRAPASTMLDLAARAGAAEEAGDRVERSLRRRQPDALRARRCAAAAQALEALEAEREVRAALGAGDGVDLVDDHVLDAAQDLARLAGRAAGRAISGVVTRMSGGWRARSRRSSAGVSPVRGRDRDPGARLAEPCGGERDPGERRAQVALDVVGRAP